MHTNSAMYCTLQQDSNGRFNEGDGSIVTDALARIPGKTTTVFTDCPVDYGHPEDFHTHLLHVIRHGGTLIVEQQRLDDGFLGPVIYGIKFYCTGMMEILSPKKLKQYRNGGVVYGNFEDFLCHGPTD
jgi:hypothetical protein